MRSKRTVLPSTVTPGSAYATGSGSDHSCSESESLSVSGVGARRLPATFLRGVGAASVALRLSAAGAAGGEGRAAVEVVGEVIDVGKGDERVGGEAEDEVGE